MHHRDYTTDHDTIFDTEQSAKDNLTESIQIQFSLFATFEIIATGKFRMVFAQ